MKKVLFSFFCFLLACGISKADSSSLPLIVNPPSSSGVNQGFSRKASHNFFDKEKSILVIESVGSTIYHSPNGNNTVFHILEFYIDPKGKELKQTSWDIFEGTDRLANETTILYENIAPYTFREELGDGEYCIYTVLFTTDGDFRQLERAFFGKDGTILSKDVFPANK